MIAGTERSLAHGTAWMTVAQVAQVVFQTVYFIIIARTLGVSAFGALAASLAVVSILVPFAAWGFGSMLVMDVSRTPSLLPLAYGSALMSIGISSLVLVPLTIVAGATLLRDIPVAVFVFLGFADLILARIVDVSAAAFQAVNRLRATAGVAVLVPAVRCTAALVFASGLGNVGLVGWTELYCAGTLVAAVCAMAVALREFGSPRFAPAAMRGKLRLGGLFAVSASASTVYADIDKMMLGRLGSFEATGIYSAADRAVKMAFIPMSALLAAAYPRFFRAGADGILGSAAYARRLLGPSVCYGIAAGLAILLLAPLAPVILGSDFDSSVGALRWLAPMPLLGVLGYLSADALTGAGAQGSRTALQLGAAGINVLLNLFLIPAYSWRGAAWSTLVSLSALAVGLWVTVLLMERRAGRAQLANPPISSGSRRASEAG